MDIKELAREIDELYHSMAALEKHTEERELLLESFLGKEWTTCQSKHKKPLERKYSSCCGTLVLISDNKETCLGCRKRIEIDLRDNELFKNIIK